MAKNKDVVTIEIAGKDWENALDKAFKKKVKEVKIDGFRKGNVPKNIYIEKFGIKSLNMEAANDVIQDAYTKALKDTKVEPVTNQGKTGYTFKYWSIEKGGEEYNFNTLVTEKIGRASCMEIVCLYV